MKKAIVLFSGGMDSTTILALAKSQGFDCVALSFNYGQRHKVELESAKHLAKLMGARHIIIDIPAAQFAGSALADASVDVPAYTSSTDIPVTYVPARNTLFLSYALAWAETTGAKDIFIGVSSVDYSHYPDCRPEFISAFQTLANLATKVGVEEGGIEIHAPLSFLSKAETIKLGLELGVDYQMTVSCYQPNDAGHACGICGSCVLRKKGFSESFTKDNTLYY